MRRHALTPPRYHGSEALRTRQSYVRGRTLPSWATQDVRHQHGGRLGAEGPSRTVASSQRFHGLHVHAARRHRSRGAPVLAGSTSGRPEVLSRFGFEMSIQAALPWACSPLRFSGELGSQLDVPSGRSRGGGHGGVIAALVPAPTLIAFSGSRSCGASQPGRHLSQSLPSISRGITMWISLLDAWR